LVAICVKIYFTFMFIDVRFPSDATAAAGQRKPFDSVQMTTSSEYYQMFL